MVSKDIHVITSRSHEYGTLKNARVFRTKLKRQENWVWWHRPGTPALGKLRQEDQTLEASLSYAVSIRQAWDKWCDPV